MTLQQVMRCIRQKQKELSQSEHLIEVYKTQGNDELASLKTSELVYCKWELEVLEAKLKTAVEKIEAKVKA